MWKCVMQVLEHKGCWFLPSSLPLLWDPAACWGNTILDLILWDSGLPVLCSISNGSKERTQWSCKMSLNQKLCSFANNLGERTPERLHRESEDTVLGLDSGMGMDPKSFIFFCFCGMGMYTPHPQANLIVGQRTGASREWEQDPQKLRTVPLSLDWFMAHIWMTLPGQWLLRSSQPQSIQMSGLSDSLLPVHSVHSADFLALLLSLCVRVSPAFSPCLSPSHWPQQGWHTGRPQGHRSTGWG